MKTEAECSHIQALDIGSGVSHTHTTDFGGPFAVGPCGVRREYYTRRSAPQNSSQRRLSPPLPRSGRVPRYVTGRRPLCATADKYLLLPHGSPTRRRQCVRSHLRHANTTRLRCIS